MKLMIVSILSIILLLCAGTANACSVLNMEEVQIGMDKGFRGDCSNNGFTTTCLLKEGSWVNCSGPAGSSTGTNLDSLIRSTCGCSEEDDRRRNLQEQLYNY